SASSFASNPPRTASSTLSLHDALPICMDSPWHRAADQCLTELAEGTTPWAIPWPCLYEFLSVVTNPRIYRPFTPLTRAIDQVERSEEHTSELQSRGQLVCRLLLEKKKT